jgi:uncharacterized protein YprB with RNaseH-like and TPR domain
MLKKDLVKYMSGRCKHRHTYAEHPGCWWKEQGRKPVIGFIDIETSNLDANYGFIITYCILNDDTGEIIEDKINIQDIRNGDFDKHFCKQLIKDMLKFDVLMGYWSTGFDIPYIRARCLKWKLEFPVFKTIEHKDVYYMVKRLLKLNRNSLETACAHFGIKGKNHVHGDKWIVAVMCDGEKQKKAMQYIIDHNRRDVIILRKLYHKLKAYDRGQTKSI